MYIDAETEDLSILDNLYVMGKGLVSMPVAIPFPRRVAHTIVVYSTVWSGICSSWYAKQQSAPLQPLSPKLFNKVFYNSKCIIEILFDNVQYFNDHCFLQNLLYGNKFTFCIPQNRRLCNTNPFSKRICKSKLLKVSR